MSPLPQLGAVKSSFFMLKCKYYKLGINDGYLLPSGYPLLINMRKIQVGGNQKGKVVRGYALIDDEDFEKVNIHSWSLSVYGYVVGGTPQKKLHRYIMNVEGDLQVDHINGDRLDNRKSNLRICTLASNVKNRSLGRDNTSGYKGVSWSKAEKKWAARIRFQGTRPFLGYFTKKEDAAKAYNEAAIKYHGEFAKLNKIEESS